ncbi:MAG: hypothetical protein JWO07_661 [Candidatus Saccharibacteria bacterium]|nr:hypothetical protein [Candidatus Saccharibacteria bacterium]
MSEYPVVTVSIIKRHDDDTYRKTAGRVRALDPTAFVIIAPFRAVQDSIERALGVNSPIEVIPDEDHNVITVLSTNAYYALRPERSHHYETSGLYAVLSDLVEQQNAGSFIGA